MEVVQLAWLYRKLNSIHRSFVVDLDREITSVIVSPEFGGLNSPLGISACFLFARLPHHLSLVSFDCVSAGSLTTEHELIYS